jgi:hypothetical protein
MQQATFTTRIDREHEARCVYAIRQRWANEARFVVRPSARLLGRAA